MPTHYQTAKMNQKKVKLTKKDKKEIKRENLKKQINTMLLSFKVLVNV